MTGARPSGPSEPCGLTPLPVLFQGCCSFWDDFGGQLLHFQNPPSSQVRPGVRRRSGAPSILASKELPSEAQKRSGQRLVAGLALRCAGGPQGRSQHVFVLESGETHMAKKPLHPWKPQMLSRWKNQFVLLPRKHSSALGRCRNAVPGRTSRCHIQGVKALDRNNTPSNPMEFTSVCQMYSSIEVYPKGLGAFSLSMKNMFDPAA